MKILTKKKQKDLLNELAATRYILNKMIYEDDQKILLSYVNQAIGNICDISVKVCGMKDASISMALLMTELMEHEANKKSESAN